MILSWLVPLSFYFSLKGAFFFWSFIIFLVSIFFPFFSRFFFKKNSNFYTGLWFCLLPFFQCLHDSLQQISPILQHVVVPHCLHSSPSSSLFFNLFQKSYRIVTRSSRSPSSPVSRLQSPPSKFRPFFPRVLLQLQLPRFIVSSPPPPSSPSCSLRPIA